MFIVLVNQMNKLFIFFSGLILLFSACRHTTGKSNITIRGKIVNPKKDYIIISRDFLRISSDTLWFSDENKVKKTININEEGLYFIEIFPEFQTIYLKPGDSLAFHINVDEFDESLSFSGGLGFENNLLIDLFLVNEKESEFFYQNQFKFSRKQLKQKLDSFAAIQNQLLTERQDEYTKTDRKFKKIIDLTCKSIHFSLTEEYLKIHPDSILNDGFSGNDKILRKELPDPNIIYMYAFADKYLERKIDLKKKRSNNLYYEIGKQINLEIKDKNFKNNMLLKYCYKYLKDNLITNSDSITNFYFKSFSNPMYVDYCNKIIDKNKLLQPGNLFPDLEIIDKKGHRHSLKSILKKETLISFWDLNMRKNFISNLEKLKSIGSRYPALQILVLNINQDAFDEWILQLPRTKAFDFYQISSEEDANRIKPFHLSQIYLLQNDTIKLSMYNMYKPDFHKKLNKYLYLPE
jgi:hypothetical protein